MNRPGFELIRREPVPSLSLYVEEYRHRRTGARHYHLVASDINNAFLVAFTTVPQDSTGVAHILEHTSLCGSQRFPVRDPFFMMSRRSLSTFMNAFTASDWTAYPFASQNRKDFNNLLEVFLDAVFFPKLDPLDFAQEGHRIEFQRASEPSSQLVHKGVVYNEMKGAMSSPPRAVWDKLYFYLFPTTTYHYNSGGDPAQIPELTYEQLKAFHARHYHPSNAVFMTYGDIPAIEHHQQFEALALSRFSAAEGPHLTVPEEHRYHAPITVTDRYALDGNEATEHRTHIVLGWLLGNSADLDAVMDAHLLSGVLLDNSSSPLRNALETSALGSAPSELCGLDDSLRETTFIAGLEGSDPEHAGSVEELILDVLEDVTRRGVPREQIESVLHQIELSQREITGGTFPYGLRLMVNVLTPILHGGDAIAALAIDPVLERLRRAILDPEYIPELTRRLLIENPHRVRLVMTPDTDLGRRREAVEAERLATLAASMNEADRQRLIEAAKALAERQKTQDDPSILPKVELTDVPPELRIVEGEESVVAGSLATWYAAGTNGMVYGHIVVDLPALDAELIDLLPVFCASITEVGCGEWDYRQSQARQAAVSGGISARISLRGAVGDVNRTRGLFVLSGKALARNQSALTDLLHETFVQARFDELPRLRELVSQVRMQRESSITDRGHSLAIAAASAGLSPSAAMSHRWSGLLGLKRLKVLDDSLDDPASLEHLGDRFGAIRDALGSASRQFLHIGEACQRETALSSLESTWQSTTAPGNLSPPFACHWESGPQAQAWTTSTGVNFCAKAYPTVPSNHPDAPAMLVLGNFLVNGFLHSAVREQGGAYGAGANYDSDTGTFRFYSYRDPRLSDTLTDFERSLEWLQRTDHEYRALEEAILGVISSIDRPDSPAGEAMSAYFGTLHGRTPDHRRRFRARVLEVSEDDLKRVVATYLSTAAQPSIAVLSSPQLVREEPALDLELIPV